MFGFLLLDKPQGIASFDCVRALRKALNIRRIGFAGTLDPLATGLMIVAIGEATKLLSYLEGLDKTYQTTVRFGAISNTYDAEGEIEEYQSPQEPSRAQIEEVLEENFLGERDQIPPAFSALHVNGKRAYELARKNEKVELKSRKVNFYDLALKSYKWPHARIRVHCSSGTYVRSLVHDLGQVLRCGAYIKELRRLKIGSYSVKNAVNLDDLQSLTIQKYLLSPQELFSDWRHMDTSEHEYEILANGGLIPVKMEDLKGPILALYRGKCVGVLEPYAGKLKFRRKFNV